MFAFIYSKTAISFNILLVLQILCLRNIFRSTITSAYIYSQCNYLLLLMVWHYKRQYAEKRLTLRKSMYICERAERASLGNFCIFTFKNCYFVQYFVGTSETLSVQLTYLSAYMYRQISKCTDKTPKKHYWGVGGGGAIAPPPLATLVLTIILRAL